jgi:allantoinase
VFGFKCFLLHSGVEEFPGLDADGLERAMAALAGIGATLLVHAEDSGTIDASPSPVSEKYRDFLASRPKEAENVAIARVLALAAKTGAKVHIVHLSSADGLELVTRARAGGVDVTVETCPHYLTFAAELIPDGATEYKCCPPIRDTANREALWAGLRAGTIDCVVSDHSPCTPDLKGFYTGSFDQAWGGISSLQLGLAAVWTGARRRGYTLPDVVRWMAEGPARVAGLRHKGRIAPGCQADFAVFAPDETRVVDGDKLLHRNPVTPYSGRALSGVVQQTWLRGQLLDFDSSPRGELFERGNL